MLDSSRDGSRLILTDFGIAKFSRDLVPAMPRSTAQALQKAMAKTPADRFAGAVRSFNLAALPPTGIYLPH